MFVYFSDELILKSIDFIGFEFCGIVYGVILVENVVGVIEDMEILLFLMKIE